MSIVKISNLEGARDAEPSADAVLNGRSFLTRFEEPLDELQSLGSAATVAGTKTSTRTHNENGDEDPGRSTRRAFDNGVR